jgi:MFS family permease
MMFRILTIIWGCLVIGAIILISRPVKDQDSNVLEGEMINNTDSSMASDNQANYNEVTGEIYKKWQLKEYKYGFRSIRFTQYFAMMLLGCIFTGVFSYVYKPIGLKEKISDRTLAWAGSISALVQAVTRLTVGSLYDKFGFKRIFYVLMTFNIITSFGSYAVRHTTSLYFVAIQLNYLVSAGIFALFPTAVYNTFGTDFGAHIYAVVLLGSSFSSVVDTILIKVLYQAYDAPIQDLFYIGAITSFIALVIAHFFQEKLDI